MLSESNSKKNARWEMDPLFLGDPLFFRDPRSVVV